MSDLLAFAGWLFSQCWRFFEITVPGTDFTFASVFLGVFFAVLGLRLLGYILGFCVGFSSLLLRNKEEGKGSGKK